jgi:hypothetical protein
MSPISQLISNNTAVRIPLDVDFFRDQAGPRAVDIKDYLTLRRLDGSEYSNLQIEAMFCRLKDFCRVATCVNKLSGNYLSAVHLGRRRRLLALNESEP